MNTDPAYATTKSDFTITFTDACTTSTISSQTITLEAATYGTTSSQTVPAFTDSLAGGSYSAGICGELTVALVGAPSWITVTMDATSPATEPFTITYDNVDNASSDSVVGSHEINYTVTSVQYASQVTQLTGTFTFEVVSTSSGDDDSNTGLIVGLTVGLCMILIAVGVVVYCKCYKNK